MGTGKGSGLTGSRLTVGLRHIHMIWPDMRVLWMHKEEGVASQMLTAS